MFASEDKTEEQEPKQKKFKGACPRNETVVEIYNSFEVKHRYSVGDKIEFEEKVCLKQFPEENVTINLSIEPNKCSNCYRWIFNRPSNTYSSYDSMCTCSVPRIHFEFSLNFQNALHHVSKSYNYSIICKLMRVKNIEEMIFHTTLTRKMDSIEFHSNFNLHDKESLLGQSGDITFQFLINRYNINRKIKATNLSSVISFDDLITSKNFGDFSIKVKDDVFFVHKKVLVAQSSYFRAMFSHDMKETRTEMFEIKDLDLKLSKKKVCATVKKMILYLYTNNGEHPQEMSIPLYGLAHQYEIHDLMEVCVENVSFNICPNNFVRILEFATLYSLRDLTVGVKDYVTSHESDFIKRTDYQNFLINYPTIEVVAYILKLCNKYSACLQKVKLSTLEFIQENIKEVYKDREFSQLFQSHPHITEEVFNYVAQNYPESNN